MCVDEGCKRDGGDGEERVTVGACPGLVGHGETRLGKGQQPVAERVSDGSDITQRCSFLWAGTHPDDEPPLQIPALSRPWGLT